MARIRGSHPRGPGSIPGLGSMHCWFSGRILACHAGGPGSIPGQCIVFLCFELNIFYFVLGF